MEVVLLGTGAADGWPNPFCRCPSCEEARRLGVVRGQTSALVDDELLIDCGPEAPGSAVRLGRSLAGVRHLLVTHAHADHLGPQVLLFRSWVPTAGELEVVGPADALDTCRPWVGPDDPVRFVPVAAGDRLRVGAYDVRVLPARHRVFRDGDAVLYDVTGPGGARLLWASDTGPWDDEWFTALRGARYDAVFLEETLGDREEISPAHLGLDRFGAMLRRLRDVGAVDERTDVVAVHLGHHNPPPDELAARLCEHGARAGVDGELVRCGEAPRLY
ncbi:MBL fold metallo-hydrolase [Dietzia kunjamensis]|uniref:MBL fold metallo-hydrolase n=1 Tax=Dietzia kunjamensis TaxID=322509 RepID=UPI0020980475|nr:MBL fold metallo-hydrolase [Dietzia kunjamensis]USX45739.1 MBL fold metallo-hydrolase [Dietzia kunjamensis]